MQAFTKIMGSGAKIIANNEGEEEYSDCKENKMPIGIYA